jgi:cytochrome c oxidase assembly protein subunit 15
MSPAIPNAVPTPVKRAAIVALIVGLVQLVFGAIVRISGSGMGCGDNWPKCSGYWFPPLSRPDLIVELTHRYLALAVFVAVAALVASAWRYRDRVEVGGRGGVFRTSLLALSIWPMLAILGAITVFTGNPAWATVIHKFVAVSLIAVLIVAVIRTTDYSDLPQLKGSGKSRALAGATAAAVMALVVVLLGGLTAKIPGAAVACAGFPLCGAGSIPGGGEDVQLTHRICAYLLVLLLISLPFLFRKRGESPVLQRLAWSGLTLGLLQVMWAGWMVTGGFPGVVRSLHQATGIFIWSVSFAMFYVARIAAGKTTLASHAVTSGGIVVERVHA